MYGQNRPTTRINLKISEITPERRNDIEEYEVIQLTFFRLENSKVQIQLLDTEMSKACEFKVNETVKPFEAIL